METTIRKSNKIRAAAIALGAIESAVIVSKYIGVDIMAETKAARRKLARIDNR